MVFDHLPRTDPAWLTSLATTCRVLQPAAEALLYRDVILFSSPAASHFCRSVVKRPHRGPAVHKLSIFLRRVSGAALRKSFGQAVRVLINLKLLELDVRDPSLFEPLVDVPFRLRSLTAGGRFSPSVLEAALASQASLEYLCLEFPEPTGESASGPSHAIGRSDILPKLRTLHVAGAYELDAPLRSLVSYSYPIAHLQLSGRHEDIVYALKLFGNTLVTAMLDRYIDAKTGQRNHWATSVLRNAHLIKLEHLELRDFCMPGRYPSLDSRDMTVSGLGKACPALKTFLWWVDDITMRILFSPPRDNRGNDTVIAQFAHKLFRCVPALERFGVHDMEDPERGPDLLRCAEIFERAEDGSVKGPEYGSVDMHGIDLYRVGGCEAVSESESESDSDCLHRTRVGEFERQASSSRAL
ncbi:hypothetical protein BV20DRAFT_475153 [Pilatotrama ljubarskyi]|nr:hypothetical protein BV20DRAFT_475153 [Pilatotrama ljubarskyi]